MSCHVMSCHFSKLRLKTHQHNLLPWQTILFTPSSHHDKQYSSLLPLTMTNNTLHSFLSPWQTILFTPSSHRDKQYSPLLPLTVTNNTVHSFLSPWQTILSTPSSHHKVLQSELWFSQQCCWGFKTFEMWRCCWVHGSLWSLKMLTPNGPVT
jgi:hypothetical protein